MSQTVQEQGNTCVVCYQDSNLEEGIAKVPFCGHIFCTTCILTWAGIRACCPLCKTGFNVLQIKTQGNHVEDCWEEYSLNALVNQFADKLTPLTEEQEGNISRSVLLHAMYGAEYRNWSEDDWFSCELDQLEEAIDNELEEEEALVWSRTSKNVQRQCGNRPFGASGYIRNERLQAKPFTDSVVGSSSHCGTASSKKAKRKPRKRVP
eukprot:jgi/Galph1/2579/GphlegSOOS_G1261.1